MAKANVRILLILINRMHQNKANDRERGTMNNIFIRLINIITLQTREFRVFMELFENKEIYSQWMTKDVGIYESCY